MKTISEQVEIDIDHAKEAVERSAALRRRLRRRTKTADKNRQTLLNVEHDHLKDAMAPLRSVLGKLAFVSITAKQEHRLRTTSKLIQAERQKVRKMLGLVPWN